MVKHLFSPLCFSVKKEILFVTKKMWQIPLKIEKTKIWPTFCEKVKIGSNWIWWPFSGVFKKKEKGIWQKIFYVSKNFVLTENGSL